MKSKFELVDPCTNKKITGRVEAENNGLLIYLDGYGTSNMEAGHGPPILIDLHDGVLKVVTWGDINQEDPTTSEDLSGALESARRPEPTSGL